MSPSPAAASKRSTQIWWELERVLGDPEMVDPGDPAPSLSAGYELKQLIEETETLLGATMTTPHIEFFEGSIRLIWNWPNRSVRAVKASLPDRRSYIYHEDVADGLSRNAGMAELTPQNLAKYLAV
ncbi:MAG: hypothetical protein JO097_19140 [Acidobacteriaceae bacterium]|nr:hypothetical protein [Acidobacteriaceae bacterium]MBV9766720.1 hypothetical protein [Acidobacteriaceae bacterium]